MHPPRTRANSPAHLAKSLDDHTKRNYQKHVPGPPSRSARSNVDSTLSLADGQSRDSERRPRLPASGDHEVNQPRPDRRDNCIAVTTVSKASETRYRTAQAPASYCARESCRHCKWYAACWPPGSFNVSHYRPWLDGNAPRYRHKKSFRTDLVIVAKPTDQHFPYLSDLRVSCWKQAKCNGTDFPRG